MTRGDIRWYSFRRPDKRRPVLILARDDVLEVVGEVIVVPATRTIRGLSSEVALGLDDGMPVECVLNFDHLTLARRERIGELICPLPPRRWDDIRAALLVACGFE
ncbi:MAG: type II toxin-antitoxin system PemK/MazF family toxin [Deltaproteobacteria bacterium]|nr:type II toxin-antitoxin system PemK/MazF family toxin [Deltaproteobacteria bacterium]